MTATNRRPAGPVVLALTLAALVFASCEEKTNVQLNIGVTVQPVGGSGVDTVWCTFSGTSYNYPPKDGALHDPIVATTYWQSSHGQYNQETHAWATHEQQQVFTSFKAAPEGMYLDKPFWFVIRWTDKNGFQEVLSDTAYCE